MDDPGKAALDGKSNGPLTLLGPNGQPIYVKDGQTLPWRANDLYRTVTDSRNRDVARTRGIGAGGVGGPAAGTLWKSPSTLDEITVLAESLSIVYQDSNGIGWTLPDILIELFKDLQSRQHTDHVHAAVESS